MTTIDKRIPVTLLTGFLGAGKTTLLNHLLRDSAMAGAAVLINEFGAVGIDHHLVDSVDETMMILASGCICCSVQGDLVQALKNLALRSARREIPPVTRVLIETTGLADPVPVVHTLSNERFIAARYRCDGVITAVDASLGLRQLATHGEAVRQVAMADRLLITKCELGDEAGRTALDARLAAINPGAPRIEVRAGCVGADAIFGCGIYTSHGKSIEVAAWLGEEQVRAHALQPTLTLAWSRKPARAARRHDDTVHSFVINFDVPVPWHGFAMAMGLLLRTHGAKILRVKGLMNIAGDPLPRVIQCVQEVAYPPLSLACWPAEGPFDDRRGRLVFIVCDLRREVVDAMLADLHAPSVVPALPLPTRCWLAHPAAASAPSALPVEGWVVQGKHLGKK